MPLYGYTDDTIEVDDFVEPTWNPPTPTRLQARIGGVLNRLAGGKLFPILYGRHDQHESYSVFGHERTVRIGKRQYQFETTITQSICNVMDSQDVRMQISLQRDNHAALETRYVVCNGDEPLQRSGLQVDVHSGRVQYSYPQMSTTLCQELDTEIPF